MQQERRNPFINFKDGINAVPGIFGNRREALDILNLDVDDQGWLSPRKGIRKIDVQLNSQGFRDFRIGAHYVTLGTRPDEEIHYIAGEQLVVAHWLGEKENDAVTRVYFLDADDSWVSSHRGRILYIAGKNGKYFIDMQSNRRYDWDFSALHITDIVAPTLSNTRLTQFNRLSADLLIAFTASRGHNVWSEYPGFHDGELRFTSITSTPYAFKVTYSATTLGFEGPASPHLIGFLTPDIRKTEIYKWVFENRNALRENILTTGFGDDDKSLVETIQNQSPTTVYVDKANLPDWQGINLQLEVYAAEIPEALYTLEGTDITILDEIAVRSLPDSEYVRVGKETPNTESIQGIETSLIPTEDEIFYLDAQFNHPPPESLYAITEHAGRIYGVDNDSQEVVFSHINGQGVSNRWVFPPQNALPTDASGVSPIQALEQMPNRGGLYVFKRDAIHYIDGQNIFAGLYSISVGTTTDISAADYKKNIGCISRRSIENDGSGVLFVGSDEQIYILAGKDATPVGVTIKPFIRGIPIDELKNVTTEWFNQKFFIALPESTLVLNTEHKYWTRYDWQLKDMFWSRGGKTAESIFYGLQSIDTLLELNIDTDEDFPILWEANKQIRDTGSLLTGVYVYTENKEKVTVTVRGNEPPSEVSRTFTPKLSNKYRAGCHVKGRNIDVKVESEKPITIDRIDLEETV